MTDEPEIVDLRPDETVPPPAASEPCAVDTAVPARVAAPRDLPRLMTRIFGTPLLIAPEKLDVIMAAIGPRLGITACPTRNDKEADFVGALIGLQAPADGEDESTVPYAVTNDGIALIGIEGTLVYKSSWLGALSGLTSYSDVQAALDKAMADPAVKGILLLVDSYGGECNGSFDLSDAIFAARQTKPICGVAADDAYSAAFLTISACSKVYVSRTSGVGSVGVVALHIDQSAADKERGLKYDYVYSGERKIDGNSHGPLSTPARDSLQAECDRLRSLFAASVAKYRGLSADEVMGTEASCFYGEIAIGAKFADAVGTPTDALTALRGLIASKSLAPPTSGLSGGSHNVRKAITTLAEAGLEMAAETDGPATPEAPIDAGALREKLRGEFAAEHSEIFELCKLAGNPEMAVAFVRSGKGLADVQKQLQDQRADASDARRTTGHIMPDADGPQANAAGWDTALAKARGQKGTK
jgi:capsid assembly protease